MPDNDNGPSSVQAGAVTTTPIPGVKDQNTALRVARRLAKGGIPIFVAKPDMTGGRWNPTGGHKGSGYWLPKGWNTLDAVHGQTGRLRAYQPGDALCAVMGWGLDLIDIDPRNGGEASKFKLPSVDGVGLAVTPNGGEHWFIRSLNIPSRDGILPGIDLKAGTSTGRGRGFAWIAPTVRRNKETGDLVAYSWTTTPQNWHPVPGVTGDDLRALATRGQFTGPEWTGPAAQDDEVLARVRAHAERIRDAEEGTGNTTLNEMAFKVGEYVGAGQVAMEAAYEILSAALDDWEFAAGDEQAQRATLIRALEQGAGKPRAWVAETTTGGLEEWHPSSLPIAQDGAQPVSADLFEDLGAGVHPDDAESAQVEQPAPAGDEIGTEEPEEDDDSWASIDLSNMDDEDEEPPVFLPRSDGAVCLLYRGLIHSIHGESESGKSWIAQAEAVRLIKLGEHVLFLDFENDAKKVRFRFLALGATREELKLIDYRNPDAKPKYGGKWWQHMFSGKFAMIVLDGVTDALGVFSMGTKENDDISTFLRKFPRALARRTGAAVVLIDHVTKDKDSRGRFAIGGQSKMAGLDGAAYVVETVEQMGRGRIGVLKVSIGKDKPGYVRGAAGDMDKNRLSPIATFVLDSSAREDGSVVVARLDPPGAGGDPFGTEEFDPGLDLKILTALGGAQEGYPSQSQLISALGAAPGARKTEIIDAIKRLVEVGDIALGEPSGRGARAHTITAEGKEKL